jgi:hypothetical protein
MQAVKPTFLALQIVLGSLSLHGVAFPAPVLQRRTEIQRIST